MKKEMAALSERQDLDRTSLLELQADLLTMALDRQSSRATSGGDHSGSNTVTS